MGSHVSAALEGAPLGPEEDVLEVQLDLVDDVRHLDDVGRVVLLPLKRSLPSLGRSYP